MPGAFVMTAALWDIILTEGGRSRRRRHFSRSGTLAPVCPGATRGCLFIVAANDDDRKGLCKTIGSHGALSAQFHCMGLLDSDRD